MRKGFSLVELAVVLVILGLLAGGILMGQSLIKNAQLRAVITESDKYITGAKMFRQKYEDLPGDFPDAEATWGTAHATDATCITTASTGTETCNGNGNKVVHASSARSNEVFRFWQHLANAGYIEGTFSGRSEGANEYSATMVNIPVSDFENGGWFLYSWSSFSGHGNFFDGPYLNTLMLGKGWAANNWPSGSLLTPEQAWNVDTKIDDGKPARGKMIINRWSTCTNAANSADLAADYALNLTAAGCVPTWSDAFARDE